MPSPCLRVPTKVLESNPPVEPKMAIDVLGKSADEVAAEIIAALGPAASSGCVLVLEGLSGTGKGTTVAKLQAMLPRAVCWSNGNIFRALTLLAVTHCEQAGVAFSADVLTPELLAKLMGCLEFASVDGTFDIRISGYGLDLRVSQVSNTLLKEPRVSRNIPSVAELTQGEVVKFADGAAAMMRADGASVLMEGRAPTLNYVRTPHRFELTLRDPLVIGMRRAAQRMMGAAASKLAGETAGTCSPKQVHAVLEAELEAMATADGIEVE